MRTQENVQTVKDFFAAMGSGDKQGLLALSAEDIEWIVPGEDWPLASTHRGHAGLENLLQKANETVETSYPEPPLRGDTQDARTRAGPGPWCCAPGAAHTVKPRPRGSHRSIRSHSRSANSQTGPSRSSARRVLHRRLSPTPDARGYLGGLCTSLSLSC